MKLVIDIEPIYYNNMQSDIKPLYYEAISRIKEAVRNGKPYEETPQSEWTTCNSLTFDKELLDENEYYLCPFCHSKFKQKHDFCVCGADMRGGAEND